MEKEREKSKGGSTVKGREERKKVVEEGEQ